MPRTCHNQRDLRVQAARARMLLVQFLTPGADCTCCSTGAEGELAGGQHVQARVLQGSFHVMHIMPCDMCKAAAARTVHPQPVRVTAGWCSAACLVAERKWWCSTSITHRTDTALSGTASCKSPSTGPAIRTHLLSIGPALHPGCVPAGLPGRWPSRAAAAAGGAPSQQLVQLPAEEHAWRRLQAHAHRCRCAAQQR